MNITTKEKVTKTYILEKSQEEIEILRFITNRIGGDGAKTPRGMTDKWAYEMSKLNIPIRDFPTCEPDNRAIYFKS